MTENEALSALHFLLGYEKAVDKGEIEGNSFLNSQEKEALQFIIEEIQQYRAIGTVSRFEQLSKQFLPHNTDETSCNLRNCNKCDMYRKENEKYHAIGTIDEFKALKEKENEDFKLLLKAVK